MEAAGSTKMTVRLDSIWIETEMLGNFFWLKKYACHIIIKVKLGGVLHDIEN